MKKGSLSLSVNAIVIFVLAFAMLGFGLFVINMLQGEIGRVVPDILDRDSWDSPPNSENPIAFKGTFNFKPDSENTMGIGFYNRDQEADDFDPNGFLTCSPQLENTADNNKYIQLDTLSQNIQGRAWAPFEVRVIVGSAVEEKTYICNIEFENDEDEVVATVQKSIVIGG